MKVVSVLVVFSIIALSVATRRLASSSQSLSDSDRSALLTKHNEYRSLTAEGKTPGQPTANYMERLVWDVALESVAMAGVSTCSWETIANREVKYAAQTNKPGEYTGQYIGENRHLYHTSVVGGGGSIDTALDGLQGWYDKYQYYDYQNNKCAAGERCGTYTQIVYDSTRYVGCAYKYCAVATSPNGETYNHATLLTCLYLGGQGYRRPYTQGTPCSNCPTGRTKCVVGLCAQSNVAPPLTTTGSPNAVTPCEGLTMTASWWLRFQNFDLAQSCASLKTALEKFMPCIPPTSIKNCKLLEHDSRYYNDRHMQMQFTTSRAVFENYKWQTWQNGIQKELNLLGA